MAYHQLIIIILFIVMLLQMAGFGLFLRIHNLSMGGVSPIHPVLFKLSKAAMMLTWLGLLLQATGRIDLALFKRPDLLTSIAVISFIIGTVLQFLSYLQLGKNLKFGIPGEGEEGNADLRSTGLYRFSRNPMYVGFFFMVLAACLYVMNPLLWVLALFSIIVHHAIVLKEEVFMEKRFGQEWHNYASKVRRYL